VDEKEKEREREAARTGVPIESLLEGADEGEAREARGPSAMGVACGDLPGKAMAALSSKAFAMQGRLAAQKERLTAAQQRRDNLLVSF
jgi:hypothetical protein